MDSEEERVRYLSRVGREKIFKYGTYTVTQERAITQDHPFYVKREDIQAPAPMPEPVMEAPPESAPAAQSAPEPAPAADDPDALASQILSSNFKVGLSQDEVDALLNGMN